MRNPFRRRWNVERFTPMRSMLSLIGSPYRWIGPRVVEKPPAPAERPHWTLGGAIATRDRLNEGMQVLGCRDRFRVVER